MSEPQSSDHALVVLKALIEEHSSVHHVARCLGMDHTNLGRVLSGEYRLYFDLVEKVFTVLNLPVSIFYRRLLQGQRLQLGEATALLSCCRQRLGRGRPPLEFEGGRFLVEIGQLLAPWSVATAPGGTDENLRNELLNLEDVRFKAPQAATAQLEKLAGRILQGLSTRGARTNLAILLAIWSAIARIDGRRDEAREGYLLALRCLDHSGESFAEGFILQKAAYVAMDFDRLESSLLLLEGAMTSFALAGEPDWQARIYADRGIARIHQEKWLEAEEELRTALRLLPRKSLRNRFAATESLVDLLVRRGKLDEAQATLRLAEDLKYEMPIAEAYLAWRRGVVTAAQGNLHAAAEVFWAALAQMGDHGEAVDAALVALDLAVVLLKLRRMEGLRKLVADVVVWMGRLADNKTAHRALSKFVRLQLANELSLRETSKIRWELEKAGRQRRPTRSRS
jgi:tetratricopeptide (TPR) repeat protein